MDGCIRKITWQEIIDTFIRLINKTIHDENMLDEFKPAEMRKVEVEAQVLKSKKSLLEIARTL